MLSEVREIFNSVQERLYIHDFNSTIVTSALERLDDLQLPAEVHLVDNAWIAPLFAAQPFAHLPIHKATVSRDFHLVFFAGNGRVSLQISQFFTKSFQGIAIGSRSII